MKFPGSHINPSPGIWCRCTDFPPSLWLRAYGALCGQCGQFRPIRGYRPKTRRDFIIVQMLERGHTQAHIAREFGISKQRAHQIVHRLTAKVRPSPPSHERRAGE